MPGGATTCPCNDRSYRWHRDHGIPVCEAAREARNFKKRQRTAGIPVWKPGTDIEIPEFEEL